MKDIPYDLWEAVIGLEIHVQLNTKTKLFSRAWNRFGDEPNSNITEVCTGQPGALPVINKEAVRKAVQFGLAVRGKISPMSLFERKSYFYPDLPRNFQITQMEYPIIRGGSVITDVEGKSKEFSINRAHLEDDAGMLKHFSTFAGVDYNRAGVPLLEIVSEPCIHSPKEAVAYAMTIKAIMEYLDASDCNMEEGSLRIDANISVRPKSEKGLRGKIEIKNMNSFNSLELSLEAEIERQIGLYIANPNTESLLLVPPGTYRWDPQKRENILMRKKESAEDYRYFPEPDLLPVVLSDDYIQAIAKTLPELPHERFQRYVQDYGLTEYSASLLINDKILSDFFEEGIPYCSNPRSLCNWITVEFAGRLKEKGLPILASGLSSKNIAKLVALIDQGTITGKIAKSVADDMIANPEKDCEEIIKKNPDYQPVSDPAVIETLILQVLEENPQSVADYKAGKTKAFAFLIGQAMKLSRGKSSPQILNELLRKKLEEK